MRKNKNPAALQKTYDKRQEIYKKKQSITENFDENLKKLRAEFKETVEEERAFFRRIYSESR